MHVCVCGGGAERDIYIFVILESKNHNLFIKMCSAFTHWLFIWSIMTRTVLPCISHRCRVKVSVLVCCKCQYWSCIYLVSDQNQNLQYGIALMHNTLIRLDVAYSWFPQCPFSCNLAYFILFSNQGYFVLFYITPAFYRNILWCHFLM